MLQPVFHRLYAKLVVSQIIIIITNLVVQSFNQ